MRQVDFKTKISGVTFSNEDGTNRQELIEELDEQMRDGDNIELTLQRDSGNAYDANAIAVLGPDGVQLGYVSRKMAEEIAPIMDRGIRMRALVLAITGDGLTQNFGVNIRVWSD